MSMIPTSDQMSKVDKEAELKRTIEERNKSEWGNVVRIEVEDESSSSSSMSMYSTKSAGKTKKYHPTSLLLC